VQLIEAGKTISHRSSGSNAQAGHDGLRQRLQKRFKLSRRDCVKLR
jgi:L-2-hydroxyglutarate oxidase LhgO